MNSVQRKLVFGGIWLGFSAYAFWLAPPNDPKTLDQIMALSTGQWGQLNPAIVALFNLMGIWPMIYAAVALADGHCQPNTAEGTIEASPASPKAWPFVAGSFGLGAFVLLPYLALRSPAPTLHLEQPSRLLAIVSSRLFGIFLLANAIIWLGYAFIRGDWANFSAQWQNSRFIHVMSLDFCALTLLFPTLAQDDSRRHGIASPHWAWATVAFPIVGAAIYLCFRPKFPKIQEQSPKSNSV